MLYLLIWRARQLPTVHYVQENRGEDDYYSLHGYKAIFIYTRKKKMVKEENE